MSQPVKECFLVGWSRAWRSAPLISTALLVAASCTSFHDPKAVGDDAGADHSNNGPGGASAGVSGSGGLSGAGGFAGTVGAGGGGDATPAGGKGFGGGIVASGGIGEGGVSPTGGIGGATSGAGGGGKGGGQSAPGGAIGTGGTAGIAGHGGGGRVGTGGKGGTGGTAGGPATGGTAGGPATGGAGGAPLVCTGTLPNTCGGTCVDWLSDGKNCGRCGHDCLGGACNAGVCQPVQIAKSSVGGLPSSIVLDGTYAYWTRFTSITTSSTGIVRVGQDSQAPTDLFPQDADARNLAIDADFIYWKAATAGELRACQIPDCLGGFRTVHQGQPGEGDVATDVVRRRIFWTNWDATSKTSTIATGAAAATVIFTQVGGNITSLATDGTYVYFTMFTDQNPSTMIYRIPVGGASSATPIVNVPADWVRTNSKSLFFSGSFSDAQRNQWPAVYKVPLVSGGVPVLVGYYPGGLGGLFQGLFVDEKFVYWVATDYVGPNSVHALMCSTDGCGSTPTHLGNLGGGADSGGIAATDAAVFWSAKSTIFKVAK